MIDLRLSEDELAVRREHICEFVTDQVEAAGADGAVLGLSGGIDSTLTAYLAVEALGTGGVHGLVLPSTVSDDRSVDDAERIATELDIEYDVVSVEPIVDAVIEVTASGDDEPVLPAITEDEEAVGNATARIRAVLNYLVANHENRLVLGTGNRSEAAVGYFTKYGDGAVDCHPIGNLYKQQVRQLARHVGVPESIVSKTPTAELWGEQTDESELGVDYDTLDAVLALHVDGPLSADATARELEIDRETVDRVRGLFTASEHKRVPPPSPQLRW